jgi:hypothetical protein
MKQCIADSGMELVAVFDAFTYDEADENSQRVYIVARETHQDNKYYE